MRGINIAEGSKNISSRMISVKKFSNSFQSAHYSPLMVEIYILKSVKTIDGCQSFTHVSILIELKDRQKCSVSQNVSMISPWWFLMSQFSDELSARLANIRIYDHECVKMCPGLRDCHETPPDMWQYTGWQVLLCPGCGHVSTISCHCPRPSLKWRDRIFYESKGHWRAVI